MIILYIVLGSIGGLVLLFFLVSAIWVSKKSVLGSWRCDLEDGSNVYLKFEGDLKSGSYKKITTIDDKESKEFGEWKKLKLSAIKVTIMGTDIEFHPDYGKETIIFAGWPSKDSLVITDSAKRKLVFKQDDSGKNIDFDEESCINLNQHQSEMHPDLLKLCLYLKKNGIVGPVDFSPPLNDDMEYAMHMAVADDDKKILSLIKCPNTEACERTYQDSLANPIYRGQSRNGLFVLTLTQYPADEAFAENIKSVFDSYVAE